MLTRPVSPTSHAALEPLVSPGYRGLPPHAHGQRIGLFGGSFNPPHDGHRTASLLALKRLQLDRVWWLVSPGNPLKTHEGLPSVAARIADAQDVARHPRIAVSGFEAILGSPYTCDTVAALTTRCPGVHFVWLMGADAFCDLQRWRHWSRIAAALPFAVVDRPGSTLAATHGRAATRLAPYRLAEAEAHVLATRTPPAWVYLHGRRSSLSSTALREAPTTSPGP